MRTNNRKTSMLLTRFSPLAAAMVLAMGATACSDDDNGPNLPDGTTDGGGDAADGALDDAEPIIDGQTADASAVPPPDGGDPCTGVVCDPDCAVYVDRSVATPGNGATAQTALATVKKGVETAASRAGLCCTCEVRVAEGRYTLYQTGPTDTLLLRPRVSVYGGYPQGFGQARDPAQHQTILDGRQTEDSTHHVYHVVTGADEALLDGFVITGGRARADQNSFNPDNYGGGLIALNTSPTINACVFTKNEAIYGGGVYATHSTAEFNHCRFSQNTADETGGGLHIHAGTPMLSHCDVQKNHATHGAGIHFGPGTDAHVQNTTFWHNTATDGGGGANVELAAPILLHTTFHANSATAGGALHASGSAHPVITNSVFWGDTPNEIEKDADSTVTATYCDVQGGCTVAGGCTSDETGNLDADPHFLDSPNGDLRLWVTSPVVDQGDNAATGTLATDQQGDPRILDGDEDTQAVCDLGADELAWTLDTMPIIYVDQAAAGANDGTSWTDAYVELRSALAAAPAFHQIWVATGTYTPSDLGDQDASFHIPAGVLLFGGFDPAQGIIQMTLRDPETYETTLSGDIMADDSLGNTDNNSRHVVQSGHCAVLDGFTVTAGHTSVMTSDGGDGLGACLHIGAGHRFTARTCRFTDCTADVGGAVWADEDSILHLDACTLEDNSTILGAGGGLALDHPAAGTLLEDCTFDSNSAAQGGAVEIHSGQGTTLDGCVFSNNSANTALYGGGSVAAINTTDLWINGCTFTGNTAPIGGAVTLDGCSGAVVENTTFEGNHASSSQSGFMCDTSNEIVRAVGGGLFLDGGSLRISDSVFRGNSAIQTSDGSCNDNVYKYFFGVGGGVFALTADLDIVGSTFWENQAQLTGTGCMAGGGGGVAAYETTVRMVNAEFLNNAASVGANTNWDCMGGKGGGFCSYRNPDVQLANCVFAGNTTNRAGAGLYFYFSTAYLFGVTATANSTTYPGAGACLESGSLYLYNSIFWGNVSNSPSHGQVSVGHEGECRAYRKLFTYYTDIYNTAAGNGCLGGCSGTNGACVEPRHFDPGFVDPSGDPPDLRLQSGGAAVNAGSNDAAYQALDWLDIDDDGDTSELVPLDLDGNPRRNGNMDLGAYERL
jgi:hypothetical protein